MINHHAAVHVAPIATIRHISGVMPASVPLRGGSGSASPSAEPRRAGFACHPVIM